MNMNKLYQYVKEAGHCSQCPGLDQCPNDFRGHYTRLSAETVNGQAFIYDRKVPCQKSLAHERQQSIHNRVRSFYVDETALKQGYSAREMLEIDMERVPAVKKVMEYVMQTKELADAARIVPARPVRDREDLPDELCAVRTGPRRLYRGHRLHAGIRRGSNRCSGAAEAAGDD